MDSKLDWNYHIDIVRNKGAKNVSVINRVKHVLTSSALYSLYCTLVMPYLTYCCEVWGNNYNSLVFMYKAFHNSLPANLLSYFKKVNGSHNHGTRNNHLNFKVRYRRTTKKALSICVRGSKMWNSLSPDVKLTRNVNAFKKMLKCSLLENYKF